jgi:hypothetical protein
MNNIYTHKLYIENNHDMFIIVSGYTDTLAKKDLSIEERMKRTLMTSGLAITVTSLTDILTFMIGYTSLFNTVWLSSINCF